jgi:crotonobetainyl-CoA:carnitine CoA-transferase CaiB-like acyl-CoA transferase
LGFPDPTESATAAAARAPRPLDGVRVLDLSRVLAGPMCTQYLADLGATVVKVEPLGIGDETRGWPPFAAGESAIFASFNRNKSDIALDLKSEGGRDIVMRLARESDVVVENYSSGVSTRLGVDYGSLKAANPRIIYCSISGFGTEGPLADMQAYDVVMQAFTGMMNLTGEPGSGPIRSPISPIDYVTGMHAITAILAALLRVRATGEGTRIEVSLFDTAIGLLAYQIHTYWTTRKIPEKNGSRHLSMCPYQAFEARDGPFLLAITNDAQWQRFCRVAGRPELAADERYKSNAQRVGHYAEVSAKVGGILKERTGTEWLALLAEAKVPASPIQSIAEVLDHPHTRSRDIVGEFASEAPGRQSIAIPIVLDGQPRSLGRRSPAHGADTGSILRALGYAPAEIEQLFERGIVEGQP